VIPGASPTARDYHCPSPESKQTEDSRPFQVALLTVMSLAVVYPGRPVGKLN
jgi:hypothetical protein